jgi:hypothetical protein
MQVGGQDEKGAGKLASEADGQRRETELDNCEMMVPAWLLEEEDDDDPPILSGSVTSTFSLSIILSVSSWEEDEEEVEAVEGARKEAEELEEEEEELEEEEEEGAWEVGCILSSTPSSTK